MKRETKTICYDKELQLEAYRFEGVAQPFPNHFHDYYVMGVVERGNRRMICRNREYRLKEGDFLLFNPGDSHGCVQGDGGTFDYMGLNLPKEKMMELTEEIRGSRALPFFSENVLRKPELSRYLGRLHGMMFEGSRELERKELLLLLTAELLRGYGHPFEESGAACRKEVEEACRYMEAHVPDPITMKELCGCSGLSKSALLRAFTKEKGITPYRYLQTLRIGRAKELLEQGMAPAQAALETGFSHQSHFSNFFQMFMGLPPGAYGRIFRGSGEE